LEFSDDPEFAFEKSSKKTSRKARGLADICESTIEACKWWSEQTEDNYRTKRIRQVFQATRVDCGAEESVRDTAAECLDKIMSTRAFAIIAAMSEVAKNFMASKGKNHRGTFTVNRVSGFEAISIIKCTGPVVPARAAAVRVIGVLPKRRVPACRGAAF